jgi:hypothetical protein
MNVLDSTHMTFLFGTLSQMAKQVIRQRFQVGHPSLLGLPVYKTTALNRRLSYSYLIGTPWRYGYQATQIAV